MLYKGSHSFICHEKQATHSFTPQTHSIAPFGQYSLCLSLEGWPGWVDLDVWLDRYFQHLELKPDTVTHQLLTGRGTEQLWWCATQITQHETNAFSKLSIITAMKMSDQLNHNYISKLFNAVIIYNLNILSVVTDYRLTKRAFVAFRRSKPISRRWSRAVSSTTLVFSRTGTVFWP